ncbi:hypothetical protein EIP86_010579 [Pleurotus ostreatoroseus]|nr:hypothetical protein EIP86_010579 [Pleurotus ostreatoroseus]
MHITILGLGPVGCLVAHHLRQSLPIQHTIALVHKNLRGMRDARALGEGVTLENSGVPITVGGFIHEAFDTSDEVKPAESRQRIPPPHLTPTPADPRPEEPIDSLILCVKAHQTVETIEKLLPRLTPASTIVLLQNGMGIYEDIVTKIFRNSHERPHFILGSINHGVRLKKHMHVIHGGSGNITFGVVPDGRGRKFEKSSPTLNLDDITPNTPDDPEASRYLSLRNTVAALLSMELLNMKWRPMYDVHMAMRRKVVINSVINPLTALLNCRNGDLFQHKMARRICQDVCWEAHHAFHAQWDEELRAAKADGQDVSSLEFPQELSIKNLGDACRRVAGNTANNFSSMLLDVRKGRKTEISWLNGYLVGLGMEYNVSMKANNTLLSLIHLRSQITPIPLLQSLTHL